MLDYVKTETCCQMIGQQESSSGQQAEYSGLNLIKCEQLVEFFFCYVGMLKYHMYQHMGFDTSTEEMWNCEKNQSKSVLCNFGHLEASGHQCPCACETNVF